MSEFDDKAKDWDLDPERTERARRIAEAIVRQVPVTSLMTAFEYGCGTGLLGFALQKHVAQVTLADSSQGMLDVLRRKIETSGVRNMTPLLLDLSTEPPPEERYDLVCTLMTLHHVPDVDAILRQFHALLRTPGFVCIADLDREDGSFHGSQADVHKGFDRAALVKKMSRAGFRNVSVTTAAEVTKATADGTRVYPVFLAIGEKSA